MRNRAMGPDGRFMLYNAEGLKLTWKNEVDEDLGASIDGDDVLLDITVKRHPALHWVVTIRSMQYDLDHHFRDDDSGGGERDDDLLFKSAYHPTREEAMLLGEKFAFELKLAMTPRRS